MRTLALALVISSVAFLGCVGGSDDGMFDRSTWTGGMSGSMQLRLVDAPNTDVTAVVVTIDHVDAHIVGAGWVTLSSQKVTVDLLSLQGGTFALLGIGQLPAGHLTQIRLYTDDAGPNYVITPDGAQHPLDVPSGDESGIKLKIGVDIQPCASGNLTLDFDGHKSIWVHPRGAGAGDLWNLRPVIRLKSITQTGTCSGGSNGSGSDGGASNPPATSGDGGVVCTGIDGCPGAGGTTGSDGGSTGSTSGTSGSTSGATGSTSGSTGTVPGTTVDNTLPGPGDTVLPNPFPPTIGTGASPDCGSVTCSSDQICENGSCVTDVPTIF